MSQGRQLATANAGPLAWLASGLILAVGALLRFYRTGAQVIIDDEWHALNAVQDHGYAWIFTHLSRADHSIPLTLFYEWLSRGPGLNEWWMRLPSMLAGVALIAVFPVLARPWLRRNEALPAAGLIAISPFLVFYSRIARPYALLALLGSTAILLAWRWWRGGGPRCALGWAACTVLAAWLNPVSLATTLAPFAWIGPAALARTLRNGDWRPLLRAAAWGGSMLLLTGALLYAPLSGDLPSLLVKSGVDRPNAETAIVMLSLYSGTGRNWLVALVLLAVAAGWLSLWRRDRATAGYLALVAALAMVAVSLSGAEWIHQAIVPGRYLIGLLPIYLALAAIALAQLATLLGNRLPGVTAAGPMAAGGLMVALVLLGPVPSWDLRHSQFVGHLANQYDYQASRNPYQAVFGSYVADSFYADIAREHPAGDAVVVEAPWHLESFWNPLILNQAVHRQQVRVGFINGVCAEPFYGEIRADATGMAFRNFVRLQDLFLYPGQADYLVLRRRGMPDARPIPMRFDECVAAARAHFGPPWRESEDAVVFRLTSGGAGAAAASPLR